jgi:hypothetical protein
MLTFRRKKKGLLKTEEIEDFERRLTISGPITRKLTAERMLESYPPKVNESPVGSPSESPLVRSEELASSYESSSETELPSRSKSNMRTLVNNCVSKTCRKGVYRCPEGR